MTRETPFQGKSKALHIQESIYLSSAKKSLIVQVDSFHPSLNGFTSSKEVRLSFLFSFLSLFFFLIYFILFYILAGGVGKEDILHVFLDFSSLLGKIAEMNGRGKPVRLLREQQPSISAAQVFQDRLQ